MLAVAGTGMAGTAASLIATVSPAGAEPIGDCSTTTGVIVVVDFAHWGGTVERGCAATPTTGYRALTTAGFTTAGTEHNGPAFICRIDTKPTPTQTACVNTPPATAYWSYWHATALQTTWSYSQLGAMTYRPPAGSVTVWVFGGTTVTGAAGNGKPTFTPAQVRATNTTPSGGGGGGATTTTAAPTTTTTTPTTTTTTTTTTSTTVSPAPTPPGATTTTSTTAATGTTTTTAPGEKTGGTSGSGPKSGGSRGEAKGHTTTRIVDVDPASTRVHPSSGSPLPVIVGGIAVVVVTGAAAGVAWRRRRASHAE